MAINIDSRCCLAIEKHTVETNLIRARVHNISREGECQTTYIPCTNALCQVTPVNYHIFMDLIYK